MNKGKSMTTISEVIQSVEQLLYEIEAGYGPGWESAAIADAWDTLKSAEKHLGKIYSNQEYIHGQEPHCSRA
jgi:hypothetical protein